MRESNSLVIPGSVASVSLVFPMLLPMSSMWTGFLMFPCLTWCSSVHFPSVTSPGVSHYLDRLPGRRRNSPLNFFVSGSSAYSRSAAADGDVLLFHLDEHSSELNDAFSSSISETDSVDEELRDANRMSPSIPQTMGILGSEDFHRIDHEAGSANSFTGVVSPLSKFDLVLLRTVPVPTENHENISRSLPSTSSVLLAHRSVNDRELQSPGKSRLRGYNSDGDS